MKTEDILASCKSEKSMCNRAKQHLYIKSKGQKEEKTVIMKSFHACHMVIIMCFKPDVTFVVHRNYFTMPL
jgi:hypothetical protein